MRLSLLLTFLMLYSVESHARKATLRWKALKGAKTYEVEVKRQGKVVHSEKTSEIKLRKEFPAGEYRLTVRALDEIETPGEWAIPQNFTVPLAIPTPQTKDQDGNKILSWNTVPEATGYELKILKGSEKPSYFKLTSTTHTLVAPTPGRYEWQVRAELLRPQEPLFAGAFSTSQVFEIKAPERAIASVPAQTEFLPLAPREKRFTVSLNGSILPYVYKTDNNSTDNEIGVSLEGGFKYQFLPNYSAVVNGAILTQQIYNNNYTKILSLGAQGEWTLAGDKNRLIGSIGIFARLEDWFLVKSRDDTSFFSTLAPQFHVSIKQYWNHFTLSLGLDASVPIAIVRSNGSSLREKSLNFEPRVQIGYLVSDGFELNAGVLWRPRELKLSADTISNKAISYFLGGAFLF